VQVGVPLDEPWQPTGVEAESGLPDQHLAVGLVAGADADGGDLQLLGDLVTAG
jgi:hypothetical protein